LRRQWKKGADDAGMGCKKIVANCGEIKSVQIPYNIEEIGQEKV